MVRYGKVLGDAWRKMWRSWAMWGWLAIGYGFAALAMLLWFSTLLTMDSQGVPDGSMFLGIAFASSVLGLFSAFFYLLYNGALVHLSNEGLEGRPVRFGDGWRVAWRMLPRVAGLEILIGIVAMILFGVVFGGFAALAVGMDSGSEAAAGGFVALFCCGYALFLALASLFAAFALAFEAIAVRAIVLSGTTVRVGMATARDAIRHRFKQVFVMGIILIGIYYGVQTITSMLLVPFQFGMYASMPDPAASSTALPTGFFNSYAVMLMAMIVITYALYVPFMVFVYYVWTGFYRQLFGIDVAAMPAAPVQPARVTDPSAEEPAGESYSVPAAPIAPVTPLDATGIPAPPAAIPPAPPAAAPPAPPVVAPPAPVETPPAPTEPEE